MFDSLGVEVPCPTRWYRVNHDKLMAAIARRVNDKRMLRLIDECTISHVAI